MLQPRAPSTQGSVDEMSDSSSTFSPVSNSPHENVKLILHILHHLLYLLSSYFNFLISVAADGIAFNSRFGR